MRYAIVSDIHANRQAWDAVSADIDKCGVDDVICLGDIVGYGPRPAEVLEAVYDKASYYVLGNHDAVVCQRLDPDCFNNRARDIINWTCEQLSPAAVDFFQQVPLTFTLEDVRYVHAEAREPERFAYVESSADAKASFDACSERLIFIGHTHEPCIYELGPEGIPHYYPADSQTFTPDFRYLVNVGSVGDPRDGTVQATYVIYDTVSESVTFRRVPFDTDAYLQDIREAGLSITPALFSFIEDSGKASTAKPHKVTSDFSPSVGRAQKAATGGGIFQQQGNRIVRRSTQSGTVSFGSRLSDSNVARSRLIPGIVITALAGLIIFLLVSMFAPSGKTAGRTDPVPPPAPPPGIPEAITASPADPIPAVVGSGTNETAGNHRAGSPHTTGSSVPESPAEPALTELASILAGDLLNGATQAGQTRLSQYTGTKGPEFSGMENKFLRLARMPNEIMGSFSGQIGQQVGILVGDKEREVEIISLSEGTLKVRRKVVKNNQLLWSGTSFSYESLPLAEKLQRVGRGTESQRTLMKGLVYYHAGKKTEAIALFRKADGLLAVVLAEQAVYMVDPLTELRAVHAIKQIEQLTGVSLAGGEAQLVQKLLFEKRYDASRARAIRAAANKLEQEFSQCKAFQNNQSIIEHLQKLAPQLNQPALRAFHLKVPLDPASIEEREGTTYSTMGQNFVPSAALATEPEFETTRLGPLVKFDGSSQYVHFTRPTGFSGDKSFTVSCWARQAAASTEGACLFVLGSNADQDFGFIRLVLGPTYRMIFPHSDWNSGESPKENQWSFHVLVHNAKDHSTRWYVDGRVVGEPLYRTLALNDFAMIGAAPDRADTANVHQYFSGNVKDFHTYQRSMSPQEISQLLTQSQRFRAQFED